MQLPLLLLSLALSLLLTYLLTPPFRFLRWQNKLRQLDDKQQELITDNLELKELCLYLDEERAHVAANALCAGCGAATRNALRDDGDGSSSSTNADETITALRNYAEQRQLPVSTTDIVM